MIHTIKESLCQHYGILIRFGSLALFAGIVGGTTSFLIDKKRGMKMSFRRLAVLYLSKIALGCFAAYLALISLPLFAENPSPEAEQLISILAAIMGSDFIAIIMHKVMTRVFGEEERNELGR